MNKFFLPLLALLFSMPFNSSAQRWKKIKQSYYNMTYKLPSNWWLDGFGSEEDWEAYGSSVCECAGSINGYEEYGDEDEQEWVKMAIYPFKKGMDMERRLMVWDAKFKPSDQVSKEKTDHLTFKKTVSTWETADGEMRGNEVWQYLSDDHPYGFVIYFFGPPQYMKKNRQTIEKIIHSLKPEKLED